jgi:hypothetical protein
LVIAGQQRHTGHAFRSDEPHLYLSLAQGLGNDRGDAFLDEINELYRRIGRLQSLPEGQFDMLQRPQQ